MSEARAPQYIQNPDAQQGRIPDTPGLPVNGLRDALHATMSPELTQLDLIQRAESTLGVQVAKTLITRAERVDRDGTRWTSVTALTDPTNDILGAVQIPTDKQAAPSSFARFLYSPRLLPPETAAQFNDLTVKIDAASKYTAERGAKTGRRQRASEETIAKLEEQRAGLIARGISASFGAGDGKPLGDTDKLETVPLASTGLIASMVAISAARSGSAEPTKSRRNRTLGTAAAALMASAFLSACGGASPTSPEAPVAVTIHPTATAIRPTEAPKATFTAIPPSPTAVPPPTPEIRVTSTPTFKNGTVSSLEQAAYFRRTDDASARELADALSKTNGLVTPARLADGTLTYPGVDIQTSIELRDGKVVSGSTYSFGTINEGPNKGALIGFTYKTERDPATGALLISSTQKDNALALILTPRTADTVLKLNPGTIAGVSMQREKGAFVARDAQGRIVGVLDIETVDGKPPVWRAFDTVEFDGKTGRYVNRASQVITGTVVNLQPTPTATRQEVSQTVDTRAGKIEVFPDSSKVDFEIRLKGAGKESDLVIRVVKGLLPDAKNHTQEVDTSKLAVNNTENPNFFLYKNPDGTTGGYDVRLRNKWLLGHAMRGLQADDITPETQERMLKDMQIKYFAALKEGKPLITQIGAHYLSQPLSTDNPLAELEAAVKKSTPQDVRNVDITKLPIYIVVKPDVGAQTATQYGVLGGSTGASYAVDGAGQLYVFAFQAGGLEAAVRSADIRSQITGTPVGNDFVADVILSQGSSLVMQDIASRNSLVTGQPFALTVWNKVAQVAGREPTFSSIKPLANLIPKR